MSRLSVFWLALMGTAVLIVLFFSYPAAAETATAETAAVAPQATPVTTITVDSGTDPDDNQSRTCLTHTPCTLRRAIVQARNLPASEKPVLIAFNIPATPEEGYNATHQFWKLNIFNTTQTTIFRRLNGDIIIDGSTQPGGREDGPKIVLYGPGLGMKDGLVVGDIAGHNNNVIRGLGFQNLRTNIFLNTDYNIIEDNWFGLNDAGTAPLLRGDNPPSGSGDAGIAFTAGSTGGGADHNIIRNNYFLGLSGVAMAVRGTHNQIIGNYIGTRADGTVTEKQTDPSLVCTPVDWLGGSGISVADRYNVIEDNIFAGIRIAVSQWSLQADTMRVTGRDHTIRNNLIGLDGDANEIGVCGRGIYLSDGPKDLLIEDNQIIEPELSAISLNGIMYDANTLRRNLIVKTGDWPQVDGNPEPEDAIQVGPGLPAAFQAFQPARVTLIDELTVQGTAGIDSPCPNCVIELFLDDNDGVVEALASLAVVTADAQGNWTAMLSQPLAEGHGIRTTSTTAQYNTIPNMSAGTTTGLSVLYTILPDDYQVYLPLLVRN